MYFSLEKTNGPSGVSPLGEVTFAKNGVPHRLEGPAQYDASVGSATFYLNGEEMIQERFEHLLPRLLFSQDHYYVDALNWCG